MGNNEKICEQIRKVSSEEKDIMQSIRSQREGFISIFIRNGEVQKVKYQRDMVIANRSTMEAALANWDEEGEESELQPKVELLPSNIYRRFAYMVATVPLSIPPMVYGHLRYQFVFEKNGDADWQEVIKMTFDEERHYKPAYFA